MIFIGVKNIKDKKQKEIFLELVLVYIRIVESVAKLNTLAISTSSITDVITQELASMGIINSDDDLPSLKQICGIYYHRLINCVGFYTDNQTLFGEMLLSLSNSKRAELQKQETPKNKPTFVDFFSGAGGLSCGFTQAGYKVSLANDYEDVCVRTYRYNHPELSADKVIEGDIRNIVNHIEEYDLHSIDIVVGGPPCQGFSCANQQRLIDDPRNELYKYFVSAVGKIMPKFVLMENVRGMLKVADQVVEDFKNINQEYYKESRSYLVAYRLLNAANFSVAQSRERLIYIAIRNDVAKERGITPEILFDEIERAYSTNRHFVLQDALEAIKPLDAPRQKNQNEIDSDTSGMKIDVNCYNGGENEYLKLINSGREIPLVFNHKARYLNDVNYDIYRLLNQGDDASDAKIADIMPYKHRLHCFKDKYYKLIADRPSRTITAHLRMDCHSHIHPYQIRAITPREAARCQSFPDDYLFLGAYLKTYMEIGNAVPVLMAKEIATVIKKYI